MLRICNTCGILKPLNQFPRNGVDQFGNIRRRPDCNVCYTIKRKIDKTKHAKFVNNVKHRTGEEDTYSLADWRDALIYFYGACAYCGKRQSRRVHLTRDHVVPVHTGGTTTRHNIVPACQSCNSSKADSELGEWFTKQRFFTLARLERIRSWI